MSMYSQLKLAADALDTMADSLEAGHKKLAAATADLKKVASAPKAKGPSVEVARLAKTAAASLRAAGLISSDKLADQFAAEVTSHEVALQKIAQLSKVAATAPRLGKVVPDTTTKTASADEVYNRLLLQAISSR